MSKFLLIFFTFLLQPFHALASSALIITCANSFETLEVSNGDSPSGSYHLKISDWQGAVKYQGKAKSYHSSAPDTTFWTWISVDGNYRLNVVELYDRVIQTDPADLKCIWGE